MKRAAIVQAKRTPIGKAGGILKELEVHELAAPLIRHLAGDAKVPICDVILGNVVGPGGNVARLASLEACIPLAVPGMTIDRQCSAGLRRSALLVTLSRERLGTHTLQVEQKASAPHRSQVAPGFHRMNLGTPRCQQQPSWWPSDSSLRRKPRMSMPSSVLIGAGGPMRMAWFIRKSSPSRCGY